MTSYMEALAVLEKERESTVRIEEPGGYECILNYDGDCRHPNAPEDLKNQPPGCHEVEPPHNCPLRQGPVLVSLRTS